MSTWTSDAAGELIGLGVDTEDSGRFHAGADAWTWTDVFSPRELAHARSAPDPARALCGAFCVKEALLKALGAPFSPEECELCLATDSADQALSLAPALRRRHGIAEARVRVGFDDNGACLALLQLFGPVAASP